MANLDKSVILSLLKNNFKCLTENPPDIVTRILLALSINPLNDFHLVPWKSFAQFRRLASLKYTKREGKHFLMCYLMANRVKLSNEEFWVIVAGIIRKLSVLINSNNVERLIEKMRLVGD